MNTLRNVVPGSMLLALALAAVGSTGCETRERVVVRDPPREHVVVEHPVVQERVVVRP